MLRRGEWAIVLSRVSTPTRIVVPFLAGASQVRYPPFRDVRCPGQPDLGSCLHHAGIHAWRILGPHQGIERKRGTPRSDPVSSGCRHSLGGGPSRSEPAPGSGLVPVDAQGHGYSRNRARRWLRDFAG